MNAFGKFVVRHPLVVQYFGKGTGYIMLDAFIGKRKLKDALSSVLTEVE
jgi:hypothetical protein